MAIKSLSSRSAILLVLLIGTLDWLTGFQISFSLFYLIPLIWFALIRVNVSVKGSWIRTEVVDQGVGIPDGELSRLFQFFTKTSSRPTAGESSTGLGLAIVKKIITLHGGTVGATSILNQGSTFFFELPAA